MPNPDTSPTPLYPASFDQAIRDKAIWEWESGITEAPDEDTFTAEDSTGYMQGWLKDGTFLTDALATFIGYSYVDQSDPFLQLNRKLPAFNPRFPWLFCNRVQIKGVKSTGQDEDVNAGTGFPCPTYDRYRFKVYTDGLPYVVRSDDDVDTDGTGEWGRYITIDSHQASELFVQEGGSFRYVNSVNALPPPLPSTGLGPRTGTSLLGAGLRLYAERTDLIVTSYGVAHDLILDEWGMPRKFLIAKGKVNSDDGFLGRPAGTMLLKNYEIKKTPQPIATQDNGRLLFGLRIQMTFGFFDPPRGDPNETRRGWNLAPYFNASTSSGYYYVEDENHKPLYASVQMDQLLTHQSFTTGGYPL